MVQTYKIGELTWDSYVYPRKNKSNKTVDAYAEALGIGAEFPPLEVQRVSDYVNCSGEQLKEATLILDGIHRWLAYEKCELEEIGAVEWQPDKVLDYEENKIELALEAAERNTRHGDRVSDGDKEAKARQIALDDSEGKYSQELIAHKLGVKQQRISDWTSDIRARQKASRDSKIIRLARLGWVHREIGDTVGLSHTAVGDILESFTEHGKTFQRMLSEGRSMEEIADHYSIDLALAWALRLEGKTDQERFAEDELNWGLRTWDDWYFNDCDKRFGDDCPGRIPAQLVAHALFYFTRQGGLVMDPMAGGGVVPDVCLAFERKCRAFDMVTSPERPEIEKHCWGLGVMQWPSTKKPDLIFFDPPYFTKKAEEYAERAQQEEAGAIPISSLPKDEYLAFFEQFFRLAHENTKDTTRLAFLNADWRDFQSIPALDEDPSEAVTIFDYERLLSGAGWQVTHRIESRMSTQRFSGGIVSAMQESRILGTVGRTLLVARKRK